MKLEGGGYDILLLQRRKNRAGRIMEKRGEALHDLPALSGTRLG
jgi:hypothetical protein